MTQGVHVRNPRRLRRLVLRGMPRGLPRRLRLGLARVRARGGAVPYPTCNSLQDRGEALEALRRIRSRDVDLYLSALKNREPRVRLFACEALGRTHVDEINERLGLELPEDDEYDTVGGFILAELGRAPRADQAGSLVVGGSPDRPVHLSEVASVRDTWAEPQGLARLDDRIIGAVAEAEG